MASAIQTASAYPSGASGAGWTGLGNIVSQDGQVANVTIPRNGSADLTVNFPALGLPSDAKVVMVSFVLWGHAVGSGSLASYVVGGGSAPPFGSPSWGAALPGTNGPTTAFGGPLLATDLDGWTGADANSLSVALTFTNTGVGSYAVYVDAVSVEVEYIAASYGVLRVGIVAGNEDGDWTGSTLATAGNTLRAGRVSSATYNTFLRFSGLGVVAGKVVTDAFIFARKTAQSGTPTLTVRAAKQSVPTPPTNVTTIDGLPKATATSAWVFPTNGDYFGVTRHRSPDLSAIFNEVNDAGHLANGNALVLLMGETTGADSSVTLTAQENTSGSAAVLTLVYVSSQTHVETGGIASVGMVGSGDDVLVMTEAGVASLATRDGGSERLTMTERATSPLGLTADGDDWFLLSEPGAALIGFVATGADTLSRVYSETDGMALLSATLAGVDCLTHHEDQAGLIELWASGFERLTANEVAPAALGLRATGVEWMSMSERGVALLRLLASGIDLASVIEDGMAPIVARLAGTERIVLLRPLRTHSLFVPLPGMDGDLSVGGMAGTFSVERQVSGRLLVETT